MIMLFLGLYIRICILDKLLHVNESRFFSRFVTDDVLNYCVTVFTTPPFFLNYDSLNAPITHVLFHLHWLRQGAGKRLSVRCVGY